MLLTEVIYPSGISEARSPLGRSSEEMIEVSGRLVRRRVLPLPSCGRTSL